ncbi:four-carbon acid sugar kinase family protein [Demequina sp. SO4-13]|uniref:four-carbon acid sugar kinase family protein n=1 Tax=Demequina sp. SO4-13 TaxID=3401027 RepID=UPI003AF59B9C
MASDASSTGRLAHRSVASVSHASPSSKRGSSAPPLGPNDRLIVIDDDPTGSQAVHGVQVVASTNESVIEAALRESATVFFLSNARALPEAEAAALITEIARAAAQVCERMGLRPVFASRSDSTLRGHFPADVAAIATGAGLNPTILLVPCFVEGGRWTIDDVHWVRDGDELVPVGQTPYARDSSFGFDSSRLDAWVEEKSGGAIRAADVARIGLDDLRRGEASAVAGILHSHEGGVIAVNAVDYEDLDTLVEAVGIAEAAGMEFVYRTGASYIRARAGIEPRGPVGSSEAGYVHREHGGLVVCGSHVPLATAQIDVLVARTDCEGIEIAVADLLSGPEARAGVIDGVSGRIRQAVHAGRHAVAYTTRELIDPPAGMTALEMGKIVSTALIDMTRAVRAEVGFLVAKGGITSHDVATQALELERGVVLGQVIPGVSAWRVQAGAVPGQTLVVFPGNVGMAESLSDVVDAISQEKGPTGLL